jgi:hypothetical protein
VACTPEPWDGGNVTIRRTNESVTCKISNNKHDIFESPSEKFNGLCEKLYYYMANTGKEWTNAIISYTKNGPFVIEAQFDFGGEIKNDKLELINLSASDSELTFIVRDFIKAYEEWNTFAFERRDISKNTTTDPSYLSYKNLIETYSHKDKKFQGLAYGGESSHSLRNEKIISVIQSGKYGIVNTLNTKDDEHEYHFIYESRWILDELFYVDPYSGRKYECL